MSVARVPRLFSIFTRRGRPIADHLCSQQRCVSTQNTEEREREQGGMTFRRFIEYPLEQRAPEGTTISSEATSQKAFDFARATMAQTISVRYTNFLISDVNFRMIQGAQKSDRYACLLPWGFIRPITVNTWVSKFARQGHFTFDLEIPLGLHIDATQELLQRVGGADSLLQGAKQAYLFLAQRFSEPRCTIPKDAMCPFLQHVFVSAIGHYSKCDIQSKVHLEEDDLEAELLGIWTENGKGSMPISDFFSVENFSGIMTELLNPLAEPARRVVAAVKFNSLERFELVVPSEFEGDPWLSEIGESVKSVHTHYWVFESVLSDDSTEELNWKVRSINMINRPVEGTKTAYTT